MTNVVQFPTPRTDPYDLEEYRFLGILHKVSESPIEQRRSAAMDAVIHYCGGHPDLMKFIDVPMGVQELMVDLIHLLDSYKENPQEFLTRALLVHDQQLAVES